MLGYAQSLGNNTSSSRRRDAGENPPTDQDLAGPPLKGNTARAANHSSRDRQGRSYTAGKAAVTQQLQRSLRELCAARETLTTHRLLDVCLNLGTAGIPVSGIAGGYGG